MKVSCCLFMVFICLLGCKNHSREKAAEKDIMTEKDNGELDDLFSTETFVDTDSLINNTATVIGVEKEKIPEIVSYKIVIRECKKCDGQKVLAINQNIDSLNYQLIYDLLCTFDESCSSNVEYSEFSNEVLYKVLARYPKAILDIMSNNPELNLEQIYSELSSPLLDYNYDAIISSLIKIEGDENVKAYIINSIKKAIEG